MKEKRLRELFVKRKRKENRNSQGKDTRNGPLKETAKVSTCQGGDLSTPKTKSQGEDPRTFKEPVERWRVQKKWKEKKWQRKKKKKDKEKKVKYRRNSLWEKAKDRSFHTAKLEKEEKEKKGRKSKKNAPR